MIVGESLYEPLGEGRYRPTLLTQGPWDPGHQHGGPPAALLAGVMEGERADPEFALTRFTMEILGPVPLADLAVRHSVVRDGRRIRYLMGELVAGERTVAVAHGWWLRTGDTEDIAADPAPPPAPVPERDAPPPYGSGPFGYYEALNWRFARGSFDDPGPATAWLRLRVPVLPGVEPTPMQRLLGVVDSASGVSNEVPFSTHLFSNVDLSVHVQRQPDGEWICVDAATRIGPNGSGVCRARLYDEKGDVGGSTQALFVRRR